MTPGVLRMVKSSFWRFYLNALGVTGCKNITVYNKPIIAIKEGAIRISDNVVLHSSNKGYHAQMCQPVKLYVDAPGAVIEIGSNSRLNGCCIHAKSRIEIGQNCLIAANVNIIDTNGHVLNPKDRINPQNRDSPREIIIGSNVWIGLNAVILKGVRIGDNSVISANCVVSEDIPPDSLVKSGSNVLTIERMEFDDD